MDNREFTHTYIKYSIVAVLAFFQLSIFMKPSEQISRNVAEVGSSNIDTSVLDEIAEENKENGSNIVLESDQDRIPEKLPAKSKVTEALKSYETNNLRCIVKQDDVNEMNELRKDYKKAYRLRDTEKTKMSYALVAQKLIELELLEDSASSDLDSESELSDFDLGMSEEKKTTSSVFLDENDKDDLKIIGECHLDRMKNLDSVQEREEYYKKNIENKYADSFSDPNKFMTPQDLLDKSQLFYLQSIQADKITDHNFGFNLNANAHSQAAIMINAQVNEIRNLEKANPADPMIQIKKDGLKMSLDNLGLSLKNKTLGHPNSLNINSDIDKTMAYWSNYSNSMLSGQTNMGVFSSNNPVTSVSAGGSPLGVTPSALPTGLLGLSNSFVNGQSDTSNLDPLNPMTQQPTIGSSSTTGRFFAQRPDLQTLISGVQLNPDRMIPTYGSSKPIGQ